MAAWQLRSRLLCVPDIFVVPPWVGLFVVHVELAAPTCSGADDYPCHVVQPTAIRNPCQAVAEQGFVSQDINLYVHAEGLEPPDPIKRPDLQSGTLPVTLYTCMRAEALLIFIFLFAMLTARNDPCSSASLLRKFFATVTTELSSWTVLFAALLAELRLLHSIIWFTVFTHRVTNGVRTRDGRATISSVTTTL